jgi:hypothetical protein
MILSYVHKLLLVADPFCAVRKNFRGWRNNLSRKQEAPERSRARHLTCRQREDISAGLQNSAIGPVSMTATGSNKEAVNYEAEIASVLKETGFAVEIDNATDKASEPGIAAGVEMIIKDQTIRPIHAFRVVDAFRRAGITIATKISGLRRKNDTLYITVGSKNAAAAVVLPAVITATAWQSKSMGLLLKKWKKKFRKLI